LYQFTKRVAKLTVIIIVRYHCYQCYKETRACTHTYSLTIKVKIQLENRQFYNVHATQLPLQFALGNLSSMVKGVLGEADHFHHPECALPHHITHPWHRDKLTSPFITQSKILTGKRKSVTGSHDIGGINSGVIC
jgi:hypothetical protein